VRVNQKALWLYRSAEQLRHARQWREAIPYYQKAIEEGYPTKSRCHTQLGNCFSKIGCYEDAVRDYMIATELTPKVAENFLALGQVYLQQEELTEESTELLTEAQKNFKKAVAINPKFMTALQALANTEYQLSISTNARTIYREAQGLYVEGLWEEAMNTYKEAIAQGHLSVASCYNACGLCQVWLDKEEMSMQEFDQALSVKPGEAERGDLSIFMYNRAEVYKCIGQYDNCKAGLHKAYDEAKAWQAKLRELTAAGKVNPENVATGVLRPHYIPLSKPPASREIESERLASFQRSSSDASVYKFIPIGGALTYKRVEKMSVAELRKELACRGVDTNGTQPELVAKLKEAALKAPWDARREKQERAEEEAKTRKGEKLAAQQAEKEAEIKWKAEVRLRKQIELEKMCMQQGLPLPKRPKGMPPRDLTAAEQHAAKIAGTHQLQLD